MSGLTRNGLGNRDTFLGSLMRQHGPANHISHCIYIGQISAAIAVHLDKPPIIQLQADIFRTQPRRVGNSPDRDDQFIHFEFL
jgi:hypothetical protein